MPKVTVFCGSCSLPAVTVSAGGAFLDSRGYLDCATFGLEPYLPRLRYDARQRLRRFAGSPPAQGRHSPTTLPARYA
jgi:hypothetical protein